VKGSGETNKTLQYFMVGSMGVLAASGAKSTVSDILSNMAASADVLALAKIEVEMGAIPEGELRVDISVAGRGGGKRSWT
jgi:ubiquinol-cytochrome c reductase iron-sulfur subunit